MTLPKLPIDSYSEKDFDKFKEKYLDGELNQESIKEIIRLYRIGDSSIGSICCDEMHGHSYKCLTFKSPHTGIVDRLLLEIENQKGIIRKINELSSE